MKKVQGSFSVLLVLLMSFVFRTEMAFSSENSAQTLKVKKPDSIFAPKSFDSNDNVQLVLSGFFTGYCMKIGKTTQHVDLKRRKIYIDQTVSMTPNCSDLEMYIPYASVVNLGPLKAGNYEIFALSPDLKYVSIAALPVSEAARSSDAGGTSTDERLYAPVSEISFKMIEVADSGLILVKGVFTNSCLELSEVEVIRKSSDVIEVLPIAKKNTTDCKPAVTPFAKVVPLKDLPEKDFLIHVRSMNGQSLNKVVTRLDRLAF